MSACKWMLLHLDKWPWLLNIVYKARMLQICYMSCALCNVYAWILNKVSVAFWLSSGFYSATEVFSTPLPGIMIIVLLKSAFLFFSLTRGRPIPVTTFFVFSKPLFSHFAAQIVIRKFSALLQQRCLSLSKGFQLQHQTAKICYCYSQPFHSSFVALLEVILQRCSSAACFVRVHVKIAEKNVINETNMSIFCNSLMFRPQLRQFGWYLCQHHYRS